MKSILRLTLLTLGLVLLVSCNPLSKGGEGVIKPNHVKKDDVALTDEERKEFRQESAELAERIVNKILEKNRSGQDLKDFYDMHKYRMNEGVYERDFDLENTQIAPDYFFQFHTTIDVDIEGIHVEELEGGRKMNAIVIARFTHAGMDIDNFIEGYDVPFLEHLTGVLRTEVVGDELMIDGFKFYN